MGSRSYCFTLNNPEFNTNELPTIQHERFIIWQLEKGENGTRHIQGYIELSKPQRISALKAWLPRAHFETRKGSREQARDYSRKEDTRIEGPFERGDFRAGGTGRRTDLLEVKEKIDNGMSEENLSQEHFETWLRYYKGLREYKKLRTKPRNWETNVYVYWGDSGTGKSKRAFEEAGPDAYVKPPGIYWDGYDNHEHVIIDDFQGCDMPLTMLKHILDRNRMYVPFKGGFYNFVARKIWITSNFAPANWYNDGKDTTPILRRITTTIHFNKGLLN